MNIYKTYQNNIFKKLNSIIKNNYIYIYIYTYIYIPYIHTYIDVYKKVKYSNEKMLVDIFYFKEI